MDQSRGAEEQRIRGSEEQWSSEAVKQWSSGAVKQWSSEAVKQWRVGSELFSVFLLGAENIYGVLYKCLMLCNASKSSTHVYLLVYFPVPLYRPREVPPTVIKLPWNMHGRTTPTCYVASGGGGVGDYDLTSGRGGVPSPGEGLLYPWGPLPRDYPGPS
jgi:hypothetical protein